MQLDDIFKTGWWQKKNWRKVDMLPIEIRCRKNQKTRPFRGKSEREKNRQLPCRSNLEAGRAGRRVR